MSDYPNDADWAVIHKLMGRCDPEIPRGKPGQSEASELIRWKLQALREWSDAMIEQSNSPQYGHDVKTILDVGSMSEAREIDAL